MHRIQAQAIEAEFLDPVERVVHEEGADRPGAGAVEVDRRAPRRLAALVEELRRVAREKIAVGTEMVVHDVEQHHQSARVRLDHETLEVLGCAVRRVGRERQHAVVAPAARAHEIRDRHDLDRGDSQVGQVIELVDGREERARAREGAEVQLVHDGLAPRTAAPAVVAPLEGARIDERARCLRVARIAARGRIGNRIAAVDAECVWRAGAHARDRRFVPTAVERRHRERRRAQYELHAAAGGRPEAKTGGAVGELGAERHGMRVPHPPCDSISRKSASERPCSG